MEGDKKKAPEAERFPLQGRRREAAAARSALRVRPLTATLARLRSSVINLSLYDCLCLCRCLYICLSLSVCSVYVCVYVRAPKSENPCYQPLIPLVKESQYKFGKKLSLQ